MGSTRIPMKFTEIELSRVDDLINDSAWVFEQKFDGTHGLAVISAKGVWWPGAGGVGALAHTAAIQHFAKINPALMELAGEIGTGEIVLDGEIMVGSGEYHVWDVVYARVAGVELVTPDVPLKERRLALEGLSTGFGSGPVKIVKQVRGPEAKRDLWDAVRDGGGEGVVAKRIDSVYESGVRVKTWLKMKFVKTADVVVLEVNRPDAKHGSFTLGAYDEAGQMVKVGACSAIGKDPATQVGDVIEVAYLYWTGVSVYQPRMLHVRQDKLREECQVSQFPTYSREAR